MGASWPCSDLLYYCKMKGGRLGGQLIHREPYGDTTVYNVCDKVSS